MQVEVGHDLIALSESKGEYMTINSPSTSLFKKRTLLGKRLRNEKMVIAQNDNLNTESADYHCLSVHSKVGPQLDANFPETLPNFHN